MPKQKLYYCLKPILPRRLQLLLRRHRVLRQRSLCQDTWPIDRAAGRPPKGWTGWPDGKQFALVLQHDVDTLKGHDNCLRVAELDERYGFRSSFNFVPERYAVDKALREDLMAKGFEIGVHGLKHDGKLFLSKARFAARASRINHYLKDWQSIGFSSPSMHHNLDWMHALNIAYDTSTFDTDPFEPQPDGIGTIFPFWVPDNFDGNGYVELPYTLPQDFTLFVLMREEGIDIWKKKLDWIAEHGGMALLNTHPDYMNFNGADSSIENYPARHCEKFLEYVVCEYEGRYLHLLPGEMARFWADEIVGKRDFSSINLSLTEPTECTERKAAQRDNQQMTPRKRIWIDLDNSPHVPFFKPIIQELEKRGYSILLTARDCFQVCGLANLHGLSYKRIGRHYGKNKILKALGLIIRAAQLAPTVLKERPDLALSHGSRSQLLLAWALGIRSCIMGDYEHTQGLVFIRPDWMIIPELIPDSAVPWGAKQVLRFPGIKEDVYVPNFKPDPRILSQLGIHNGHMVVTVRPPATEAHYHNPQSEELFRAVMNLLCEKDNLSAVVLPRNENQKAFIKREWGNFCSNGKIIIPDHVIDGLNLIWHSDFVISGGGTMNREAAALGVPVYSIFCGKLGAVDCYLSGTGRLKIIQKPEDFSMNLVLDHLSLPNSLTLAGSSILKQIIQHIDRVANSSTEKFMGYRYLGR